MSKSDHEQEHDTTQLCMEQTKSPFYRNALLLSTIAVAFQTKQSSSSTLSKLSTFRLVKRQKLKALPLPPLHVFANITKSTKLDIMYLGKLNTK